MTHIPIKKIRLCGINSRYLHTNLAIRSIKQYIKEYTAESEENNFDIDIREWNISQPLLEIIRGVAEECADLIIFSVYIWNVELTFKVITEIRKLLPNVLIGAGGPEVSYSAEKFLHIHTALDFIVCGEGEQTILEIVRALCKDTQEKNTVDFSAILGVQYRNVEEIYFSGNRPLILNLDLIPFPYTEDMDTIDPAHHIVYYESSRGCPFKCAYCLSSLDTRVRYVSLERVFTDLHFFLSHNFKLIKFVDRTFNLNPQRYIAVWKYIIENYNGITTFHFEISAHDLVQESFEVLKNSPPGAIQFEIGIQSINEETLTLSGRKNDLSAMVNTITRIPKNIHMHLDLIAGLPKETLATFREAYNFTIALKPGMLQLGFLKVLSGTDMERIAVEHSFIYQDCPPYEILATPTMPYKDIVHLKDIEHLGDIYYNSGLFVYTMSHIIDTKNVFDFFSDLTCILQSKNILYTPRKTKDYFAYLVSYFSADEYIQDLLRFDFIIQGKIGSFPEWFVRNYSKESHEKALRTHTVVKSTRESYTNSEYERFNCNPLTGEKKATAFLILYETKTYIEVE